jgi:hypothetical protein
MKSSAITKPNQTFTPFVLVNRIGILKRPSAPAIPTGVSERIIAEALAELLRGSRQELPTAERFASKSHLAGLKN